MPRPRPRSAAAWRCSRPATRSGSISASARANILISDEELAKRKAAWKPHVKESQTPWQELQRKFVGQLASGACLDFAVNYQRIAQTKGVPRHSH